jgi:general secretion pathway protein G
MPKSQHAFTLIEVLIAVAIVATLLTIAIPAYKNHREAANISDTIADITEISAAVDGFYVTQTRFPDSLADVGMANKRDPWGNPYQYLNISDPSNKGKERKDHKLKPVNSDYDLYSRGLDGESKAPFNNSKSQDDVVRANNGKFIGLAAEY